MIQKFKDRNLKLGRDLSQIRKNYIESMILFFPISEYKAIMSKLMAYSRHFWINEAFLFDFVFELFLLLVLQIILQEVLPLKLFLLIINTTFYHFSEVASLQYCSHLIVKELSCFLFRKRHSVFFLNYEL